jgi:hypothetical protein
MNRKLAVLLVAMVVSMPLGIASAADGPAVVDPAYQQSFEKWKGDLVEDLKQEWLPLAGLFWLKPGENSFGTDAKNAIVFPKGPAHAGSFTLQGQVVTVKLAPGVNAVIAGKPAYHGRASAGYGGQSHGSRAGKLAVSCDHSRRARRHPAKRS